VTSVGALQCVEYVRLPLVADPSSNGHTYFARLSSSYQSLSYNTRRGSDVFVNSQVLCDAPGRLQVIPPTFGTIYEAKVYSGGTENIKGSGTVIPLADARMWYFDYVNGVFYQEVTTGSVPSYVECFVYIGPMLSNMQELVSPYVSFIPYHDAIVGDYSILDSDCVIPVDSSLISTVTVTLPMVNSSLRGKVFHLKDVGGEASVKQIYLVGYGSNKIDGSASPVQLDGDYACLTVVCNGVDSWHII
jgi:hypothetical protein